MKTMLQKVNASLKKNNKGFTLVELIIVIAIIAVLGAVIAPQYIKYVEKSKEASDKAAVAEILHAAEVAAADPSVTPVNGKTMGITITASTGVITITTTGDESGLADSVSKSVGTGKKLQSTDGKGFGSLGIKLTDGSVAWDTDSATKIAKLENGISGS
jgi:prepilin-type N-terminal cleavage/methylation domain-containing protein